MEPAIYSEAQAVDLPHPSWMGPMLPPDGQREIEDAAFDLGFPLVVVDRWFPALYPVSAT